MRKRIYNKMCSLFFLLFTRNIDDFFRMLKMFVSISDIINIRVDACKRN